MKEEKEEEEEEKEEEEEEEREERSVDDVSIRYLEIYVVIHSKHE